MIQYLTHPQTRSDGSLKKMSIEKPYKCEYCGARFTREKTAVPKVCAKRKDVTYKKMKSMCS